MYYKYEFNAQKRVKNIKLNGGIIMALHYNSGRINVYEMERAIIAAGGGKSESKRGDVTHVTVYATSCDWHLSYDILPDGSIENVHSTKNGRPIYDYKGGY